MPYTPSPIILRNLIKMRCGSNGSPVGTMLTRLQTLAHTSRWANAAYQLGLGPEKIAEVLGIQVRSSQG